MNKQRKVLITTTYNELGIIIDTKVEEVTQPNLQPTCNQLATDTISRQDAIDAMADAIWHYPNEKYAELNDYENARRLADYGLSRLPSAEPERKTGAWIDYSEDGFVECPFCHSATNCDGNRDELHYCFSCGAELR